MRTIYKFPLQLEDEQRVVVPGLLRPLTVQVQHGGTVTLWCAVSSDRPTAALRVHIVGTGHPIPEGVSVRNYFATVQTGVLVWHVFISEEHPE